MEIVGKKSQGLSVTALKDDKTVIISFNDRSLELLCHGLVSRSR